MDVTERIRMGGAICGEENKKGRAMGGMVLGIREKIERGKDREVERGEGVLSKKICLDGEW